jgi:hypothetical protein
VAPMPSSLATGASGSRTPRARCSRAYGSSRAVARDGGERSGFSVLLDGIASAHTVGPAQRDMLDEALEL